MELFRIEENKIYPLEHTLTLPVFYELWIRDESETKLEVGKDFLYIELMCNPKTSNPFAEYKESEQSEEIIRTVFKGKYKPDKIVKEAVREYSEMWEKALPSLRHLRGAIKTMDTLREYVDDFDPYALDKYGKPVYKPTDVVRLPEIEGKIAGMKSVLDKYRKEILSGISKGKTTMDRPISSYEI